MSVDKNILLLAKMLLVCVLFLAGLTMPGQDWFQKFGAGIQKQAGKTYYVAPDGSDLHDGLSRQNAFRTLNFAVKKLTPGDTLLVAGGEYNGDVRLNVANSPQSSFNQFGGKPGAPIKIMGVDNEEVVISGSMLLKNGVRLPDCNVYKYQTKRKPTSNMLIDQATHTVLQEVFAEELVKEYPGTYMRKNSGELLVHYASGKPSGVLYPRNFFGFVIAGSYIHVENITFKYCIDGVNLRVNAPFNKNKASHITIKNCRFFYNTRMGLYVDGASFSLITGNIFANNGKRGSLLTTASPRQSHDCLIAGNYFGKTVLTVRNSPENLYNYALGNYAKAPERIHFIGNYVKSPYAFRLKPASPGGRVEDNYFDGRCAVESEPLKAYFRRNYFKNGMNWLKIGRNLADKDFAGYPMVFENNTSDPQAFSPKYPGALQAKKLAAALPSGEYPAVEIKNLTTKYINRNSAVIYWETAEADGTGYVEYKAENSPQTLKSPLSLQGVKHFVGLKNLRADTLYRYRVIFNSRRNQYKISDWQSFRTVTQDRQPMVIEVGKGKYTLTEASNMAIAGDVVKLLPGEHTGVFAPVNSGKPGKTITLRGCAAAVINGKKFFAPLVNLNEVSHIVIDNVKFAEPENQNSYGLIKVRKSNNITVKNCSTEFGHWLAGPFVFVLKSSDVVIKNNCSWGFSYPLQLAESIRIKVLNNTIADAAMFSVFAENTQDMVFKNNIFYCPCVKSKNNPAYIFQGVDLKRVQSDGNVFYSPYKNHGIGGIVRDKRSRVLFSTRTLAQWQTRSGLDKNSLACDPLFEDYKQGNFVLKKNSPAAGKGAIKTYE